MQHIRKKYGKGFEIELKIDLNEAIKEVSELAEASALTSSKQVFTTLLQNWEGVNYKIGLPINLDFSKEFSETGLLKYYHTRQ